jgi:hypothetical protein
MTDFNNMSLSTKQRMQLSEEGVWINHGDEWLEYSSSEDEANAKSLKKDVFHDDPFYNDQADESDAKWVEKHMSSK